MRGKIKFVSVILVVSCLLTNVASASSIVPYASDQIDAYDVNVTASGGGEIAIQFSVEGTGVMTKLGAERIKVYEDYETGWVLVGSFGKNYAGMTSSNENSYGTEIYFSGNSGSYYKVEVTVFATNSKGTDSRTVTRYVTA